jgi:mannose-6-phosphate isomerase
MAIELARSVTLAKPWGVADLKPWSQVATNGVPIGEIWFERALGAARAPALLLKLLFTSQPLSIQVHPGDLYAQSLGFATGKTEAWYILHAATDAAVGLGLTATLTEAQLRSAINDETITDLLAWQCVAPNDLVAVPAGTIHAVGAGLVIAEIQQRADITFRMFDYGRGRELHTNNAMAVAVRAPANAQASAIRISEHREMLVSNSSFIVERCQLSARTNWLIEAKRETWLLVLSGNARLGSHSLAPGDVVFGESDRMHIDTDNDEMQCLIAYTGRGGVLPNLIHGSPGRRHQPLALSPAQIALPARASHALISSGTST